MRHQSKYNDLISRINMNRNYEKNEPAWSNVAGQMAISVIGYPFDYAKFLIQIGYEPIPPWPTTTLWGKPALGLPNIFQYIGYIRRVDGFQGCYRGLVPKLWAFCIYSVTYNKYIESTRPDETTANNKKSVSEFGDERETQFIEEFKNNFIGKTIAIILTHPLDVVWVRMMAQFIGRETKYVTIVGSIVEIYKTNSLSGFYAGFIPRFIAQTLTLAIVSLSTYLVNKYVIKDKELQSFTYATMTFLASTVTYPFLLVSQCMAINDCGLLAGTPPMMPIYINWKHCWNHLSSIKQLKRGSNVMWRTITLPNSKSVKNIKNFNYR